MTLFKDRFAGQHAVVTGGGSGIGRAVAERLTSEGAKVSVWDISESALDAIGTACSHKLLVDQSDELAVAQATALTIREFGSIDVLVVSAGITGPNTLLADYPCEAWRKVMDVN